MIHCSPIAVAGVYANGSVVANSGSTVGRFHVMSSRKEGAPMRKMYRISLGILLGLACLAGEANAQFKNGSQATELNLPTLSQRAVVTPRIGLTDITIAYHRPLANGRKISGATVPHGQSWRSVGIRRP